MATPVDVDDPAGRFKQAAGQFPSGVTVVTTRDGNRLYGITCSSFLSLSLNPLLVSVSVNSGSPFLDEVRRTGCFAVSVLEAGQRPVSQYFATRGRGAAQAEFPGVPTETVQTGAPVVSGSVSWFDARLHTLLPGGDHHILIGEVVATGGAGGRPLLYWAGDYRRLDPSVELSDVDRVADAISVQLHLSGLTREQLIEVQEALEPVAARLAARRGGPDAVAALERVLARAATVADDHDRFTEESVRFHDELGRVCGNPGIAAALLALGSSRRAHYAPGTTADTVPRTLHAHEEIVAAIRDGDEERAHDTVLSHLRVVGRGLARGTAG